MAVEINGAGYNKPISEQYPSVSILKMVHDMNIPVTLGSDAHSPKRVGEHLDRLKGEIEKIGFKEVAIFKNRKMEMVSL